MIHKFMKGIAEKGLRALVVFLCVLLVIPAFSPVFADETDLPESATSSGENVTDPPADRKGIDVKDTYFIYASTGVCPGDSVLYFTVRYKDVNGVERNEFVLPHDSTKDDAYTLAASAGTPSTDRLEHVVGYTTAVDYVGSAGLYAYSNAIFMFHTNYGLSEVIGVDMFMRHADVDAEGVKNEWTCNDVRVYKVNTVYGIKMAGYYSTDYYIDFDGELLTRIKHENESETTIDFSIAESDHLFRIGREAFTTYSLLTDIPESEKYYSTYESSENLLFRMDIADMYGSGIEALSNEYKDNKAILSDMNLIEPLMVSVSYKDIFGASRWVKLPFITSFVSWAIEKDPNLAVSSVIGVAQQGDTMMFVGTLPDFKSVSGVSIYYGTDAPSKLGIAPKAALTQRQTERINQIDNDPFAYTAFSIFIADSSDAQVYTDNAILRCTTNSNPVSYFRTSTTEGKTISVGNTHNLIGQFKDVDPEETRGVTLLPRPSTTRYVFEINTDINDSAGTTSEIFARLSYITTSGDERLSDSFSLMDAVRDFYGYWSGNTGDIAYMIGAAPGGKLVFSVDYADVDHFKSIQLDFDSTGGDDWQMNSISIYRVSSISERFSNWLPTDKSVAGNTTDREFSRTYSTDRRVTHADKKFLLTRENGILITFDNSGGGGNGTTPDVNWEQIKESMTFNEARQDLGFTKERQTYIINVKVFSNSSADDTYGDCGSNNKFYFKLIFDNGSSGFVQANQQLTADGFRAGQVETFTISVNRNYGEVRTIRIIPDDMIEEQKDVYDKLNIEYIEVIQESTSGLSRSWRVDNIGWIGIDFKDEGAQVSVGQATRTEGEISRNYLISQRGYTMNFLVALSTLGYDSDVRYSGSLTGTVYYRDVNDDQKTTNIDIAQAMGDYAGKTTTYESSGSVDSSLGGKMRRLIDTNYMLRPDSTDRFIISLCNVKSIEGIVLHACANVDTEWKINSVIVYNIIEDGPLLLNTNNEYQRDASVERLCASKSKVGYKLQTVSNAQKGQTVAQDLPIEFEDNVIAINNESWEASITRTPSGDNDTLNVFVFPGIHNGKQYYAKDIIGMQATFKYQLRDSDTPYQLPVNSFNVSNDKNMLYAYGIGTKGITLLSRLTLKSVNASYIDHAIVQQVRSDVVINTYLIDFYGEDISNGLSGVPRQSTDTSNDLQIVSLQFSDSTQRTELKAEKLDIAVSINYTTTNDIGDNDYASSNVFLTDQEINLINSGDIVDITFHEPYVKEIKSVTIIGVGPLNASIDSISIMTGKYDDSGHFNPSAQYGVADKINVVRNAVTAPMSEVSVVPFSVSFKIGSEITPGDDGVDSLGIEFTVIDREEDERTIRISDVRPYIVSGSFKPNDTVTLKMLLTDVSELKLASIKPISDSEEDESVWYLNGASASWTINTKDYSISHEVDEFITADKPYVLNFSKIVVQVSATILDKNGEPTTEFNTISGRVIPLELVLNPGNSISFTAEAAGSLEGFGYTVEIFPCDEAEDKSTMTEKDGKYYFTAEPVYQVETSYNVRFTSEENEDIAAVVHVVIPAGTEKPEEETETEAETEEEEEKDKKKRPADSETAETEPAETN